ncbi:dachshund homolog 2 isoform X2 [Ambystoma mexicanum]|uniref:dachshund homolog 2 isoform X2 n=1 Tax=Ambystoma mexicanum TaxID=8296 RepID=UPI0037E728CE
MAVSAPPPVISATPGSEGLFRADPLYSSPAESPRLTSSMINSFITSSNSSSSSNSSAGSGGGGSSLGGGAECKMVDLHGVKVASFLVDGHELICLPQVFDLFLKHLVGGLHTVYTKLKRLDISPVVCTVEQVRILRGLGAIQPGVNRCKLITRKDFETLYNDCTNARLQGWMEMFSQRSSRPGRPPKRSLGVSMQDNARLLPHGVPGLLSPGLISPTEYLLQSCFFGLALPQLHTGTTPSISHQEIRCGLEAAGGPRSASGIMRGLTAAAMAEAMKLQKMKLMAMNNLHGSGSQNGTESENEELNSNAGGSDSSWDKEKMQSPITSGSQHSISHVTLSGQPSLGNAHPLSPLQQNHLLTNRLDLPFMMMPHPLLPVSLPPASVAMAMNQMNHLNTIANMAAAAQMHSPLSRVGASVIKERIHDSPSPTPSMEDNPRPGSRASSHQSSSVSSSPSQLDNIQDRIAWSFPSFVHQKTLQVQNTMLPNMRDGELADQDTGSSLKKIQKEKEEIQIAIPIMKPSLEKVQLSGQALPPGFPAPFLFADGLSSVETLLTNIQGLLKVAVDNTRVQDKQIQQEKKELKMELCRERELRETLERQLTAELQSRATIQKRLKKEKKAKRKLQEALEFESKRREQVEQALKQATSGDGLRMLNDVGIPEMETEHNGPQLDSAAMQENRPYMKPAIMY